MPHSIGDAARLTGLTVKTVRFWSDRGIVAPTGRSPAGHRLYDDAAVARLDLVRALRDLGLDLVAIRAVLARERPLAEVAAVHAEALTARIDALRLRRAVLVAVAERGTTPEEMSLVHELATLSEDGRRRLVDDFLDAVLGGLGDEAHLAGIRRSLTPEPPGDPTAEQVRAWIGLAELCRDLGFRARLRRTVEDHVAGRAPGVPRRDAVAAVRDRVLPALAAGDAPGSPGAASVAAALTAHYAAETGLPDDAGTRERLLARLEAANDPVRQRYLELLSVVNGWPPPEDPTPALDWSVRALRAAAP